MSKDKVIVIKIKRRKEKGSGTKKYGRNLSKCGRYKAAFTREKNKKRKIAKDAKLKAMKLAKKLRRLARRNKK